MARDDTFPHVRRHLDALSDEQLEARFWELTQQIVDPLVALAASHTSPSIERSVLMRMGVDSQTCAAVVAECEKRALLGHGAGHVLLVCSQEWGCDVVAAAGRLASGDGWETGDANWGGAR